MLVVSAGLSQSSHFPFALAFNLSNQPFAPSGLESYLMILLCHSASRKDPALLMGLNRTSVFLQNKFSISRDWIVIGTIMNNNEQANCLSAGNWFEGRVANLHIFVCLTLSQHQMVLPFVDHVLVGELPKASIAG